MNIVKTIAAVIGLGSLAVAPAMANEYPAVLRPVSVNFVNTNGVGLAYNVVDLHLVTLAKTPVTLNLAPGVETNPNSNWKVTENVGAYLGVGPLEAGVTKTFSSGFGLSKPMEFSVGFKLFKN